MDHLILDQETSAYIKSESEFNHLRMKAFLEMVLRLFTGHNLHLLSFNEVVHKLRLKQSIYRGVQDIPVANIVGSTGRYEDFTREFLPRTFSQGDKERWRKIYTLAVTGKGFPPIDVYKIDQAYFVKDGNHRVSVARDLGWETIQATVTELPSPISLGPDVDADDLIIKEECAYFLEQTQLDKTRPDSKNHIDFTEPDGYQHLLRNIELHRLIMEKSLARDAGIGVEVSLPAAAANWYDHVYLPTIEVVREMEILKQFPGRSEADLYDWLIRHQTELRKQHHLGKIRLTPVLKEFFDAVKNKKVK